MYLYTGIILPFLLASVSGFLENWQDSYSYVD
jgi:hypothetical protein